MVYYRKYRPQSFSELMGQGAVVETLKKAFLNGRLSHAYLFCGPRGTGKTSTARILAKMVNCERQSTDKNKTAEDGIQKTEDVLLPCNECDSCLSITDGSNLDLIEIDAASNRGIDDIRELRDKVRLSPTSSPKKVYIIDEVHMLTTEAFNALLKTLEEPPEHALFILATTEVHKLPQTILSRVQRLDFKLATTEDIAKALKKVAEAEKLSIADDALGLIAKKAEGSFRDGIKLLDQLAFADQEITLEMVESLLSSGSFDSVSQLIGFISTKKVPEALELLQKLIDSGINLKEFTSSLLEALRMMLFLKQGIKKAVLNYFSDDKVAVLETLSSGVSNPELLKIIGLVQESQEKLRYSSIASLPLELAIVESGLVSKEPRAQSLEASESSVKNLEGGSNLKISKESLSINQNIQDQSNLDVSSISMVEITQTEISVSNQLSSGVDDVAGKDLGTVLDKWQFILETIKPYNFSLEALLKQAKVVQVEEGLVTLEVPYSFHQRILESPKSRTLLESVLSDVLGKSAKVGCVIGKRPVRIEELANVEVAADDEIIKIAAEIFNS